MKLIDAATTGNGLGYTGRIIAAPGGEIRERIYQIAYARNGNAHNPTQYKQWDLFVGGEFVGAFRTLRAAKAAI